ncbi:MAG TPA: grasp-with-spasm system SPASM domain peptide maturase, partial [Bacteroidales bacterium]|nr:grasp-with-spasm system SPASM domain peptide maturase [Bacteroidales bacterium]
NSRIFFIKNKIKDNSNCGIIKPSTFSMNLNFFCESVNFNNCLNRKVCVDISGKIKNCPSMVKSYGNIKNTNIADVLNNKEFCSFWNITKDQIEVCKDCEYRYICSDCRAFLKDPDNIYSQPAKCTYNPYIAKWEGEENYIPVEEIGTYNKKGKFIIKEEYINSLIND